MAICASGIDITVSVMRFYRFVMTDGFGRECILCIRVELKLGTFESTKYCLKQMRLRAIELKSLRAKERMRLRDKVRIAYGGERSLRAQRSKLC